MLYFAKNRSGNISDVTKRIYDRLKTKDDYEVWTEDPYAHIPQEVNEISFGKSTDYTIAELRKLRDDMSQSEWDSFTEGDTRKTIDRL